MVEPVVEIWKKTETEILIGVKTEKEQFVIDTNFKSKKRITIEGKNYLIKRFEMIKTSKNDIEEVIEGIRKLSENN